MTVKHPRPIAVIILTAFLWALGISSVHVHATHFETDHVVTSTIDHDTDASCSFCSVIKTKTAAITSQSDITFLVVAHHDAPIHADQQQRSVQVESRSGRDPPKSL
ncbi:MAG: hypothetical protein EHM43_04065 [Ignavibacteriae bacterium]|nr:MAG: hypothetical protein EHM43_04065 [Ignavibacteriota bacterium]